MVVEEVQLLQRGEHAQLRGDGEEVVAREIEEFEVAELGDLGRNTSECVVVEVKVDEEGKREEAGGGRDALDVDAAHVKRIPCVPWWSKRSGPRGF